MRETVGSSHCGICKPARLAMSPEVVAMISGLRTSSRAKLRLACRAMGQTAAVFKMGTQKPISTAISTRPCGPASRSMMARATNELKRNATCADAACSRLST